MVEHTLDQELTPDGTVSHAQLAIREGAVMLGRQGGARYRPPRRDEVNQYVLVHVEDVDGHCAHRPELLRLEILEPPADMPFGERLYTARDHAGHQWTFSQHVADVAPDKWGATSSSEG